VIVLGMTLKGAAIAEPMLDLMSILLRFFHFASESEGEVYLMMLHLHGITLLMCASMVLGKRLRFFEQIVHRKVKCRYKRPAFRDYYHKSFAFRFRKLGFRTLIISPRRLENNQWIRSFKFWKPGWHVRLKSVRKGFTRTIKMWSCGRWNNMDTPQMEKQQWNNPIKHTKLEAKQFATLCGLCDETTVQYEKTHKTMSVDHVHDPPEGANVFHDIGTRNGRRKLARCMKQY
jgi:hypothetical protein